MDKRQHGTDTQKHGDGDGAAVSQARWPAWARASAEWAGALGKLRAAERSWSPGAVTPMP
jgi:hypothetical protein